MGLEAKETCKEIEKVGFPQTARDLKYQVTAIPHRWTLEILPEEEPL